MVLKLEERATAASEKNSVRLTCVRCYRSRGATRFFWRAVFPIMSPSWRRRRRHFSVVDPRRKLSLSAPPYGLKCFCSCLLHCSEYYSSKVTMTTSSHNKNSSKQGRRLAVSVQEFAAGKKGVTRAIQEYKHRKERKVKEKAMLLREYKKIKKQEGYHEVKEQARQESKRGGKPDPYKKSLEKAQERKLQTQDKQRQVQIQKKENEKKLKQRKQRSKLFAKRTSKGQPVMKHVIHGMLDKLQKEE